MRKNATTDFEKETFQALFLSLFGQTIASVIEGILKLLQMLPVPNVTP